MTDLHRLTTDDDLFLKLYNLYGNTLGGQMAWRFDEPVAYEAIQSFHAHLAHGFMARRVRTTAIPAARPWWERSTDSHPLGWDSVLVPNDGELDWLDAQGTVDLDPTTGRGWRLSAAPTTDGGMLMSLIGSHVVADGGAAMYAIVDALQRLGSGATPSFATSSGRLVGTTPTSGLLRAHLRDAGGQLWAAAKGLRAALTAESSAEMPRNPRPGEPKLKLSQRYTPASVVVETSLDQWKTVAAAHEGTANGLMIGIAVGLLGRTGRVADGADVRVDVPHSLRGHDDPRGNASTGLPIAVTFRAGTHADLAQIRAAVKNAGSSWGDAASAPAMQHLQPLLMMLPSQALRVFSRTAKAAECLCTNLGDAGTVVGTVGGVRARSVIMRAVMATDDTELFRRLEGGVHLTWSTDGDYATVAIHAMDPDRFPTREALRGHVEKEFHAWGLTPRFWT